MNKLLLRLIDSLAPLWRSLNADPAHLRTILEIKLLSDGRRRSAFTHHQQHNQKSKKPVSGQDLLAMFMYLLMGGLFLIFFAAMKQQASGLVIYFAGWMFMLALTLIADFTDVLIDVRDNYILLPRPVNDQTIVLSRILHVFFYLIKLIVPFFLPGVIYTLVTTGIGGMLLFLLLASISTLLALFIVNLVYLLLLQVTSPRQFRDVIGYFQMFFSALMLFGFNVLPRLVPMSMLKGANLLDNPFWRLTPPAWLAALWDWWINGNTAQPVVLMGILGLIAPAFTVWAGARLLTRDFNQKLMAVGEGGSGAPAARKSESKKSGKISWMDRTANWWRLGQLERAAYELTWKLTQRNRDFKLKFFPSFIFTPVMIIIVVIPSSGIDAADKFSRLEHPGALLGFLYISILVLFSGIQNTSYSDRFKASWMFSAAPVIQPGLLISGAVKVILTRFFLPYYLAISLILVRLAGLEWIGDCVLALFVNITVALTAVMLFNQPLPFSQPWENQSKGTGMAGGFLLMFLGGLAGFLHYLLRTAFPGAVWAAAVLAFVLTVALLRAYKTLSWRSILT